MIRTIPTVDEMKSVATELKSDGNTIGLVPTMGYFHEGHLSLIRKSNEENDATIVSLFVNPTQFGPKEDLDKYPRDIERDTRLADEAGAGFLFTPTNEMMYPQGYKTYVGVEDWSGVLCGVTRPIHFRGVTTICNKLFNICRPDRAYFGLKDAQQYMIIRKMVADLNMNLEIVPMPTVREPDGLAMSSRNVYLKPDQRKAAVYLSRALNEAKAAIGEGTINTDVLKATIRAKLGESPLIKIDYIEIVSADTLESAAIAKPGTLIAIAAFLGETRLIDNLLV